MSWVSSYLTFQLGLHEFENIFSSYLTKCMLKHVLTKKLVNLSYIMFNACRPGKMHSKDMAIVFYQIRLSTFVKRHGYTIGKQPANVLPTQITYTHTHENKFTCDYKGNIARYTKITNTYN